MTTRRLLLAVALLMLGLVLAAGLNTSENSGTPRTPLPRVRPAPGATVAATFAPGAARPKRVVAKVGDLVRLQVVGRAPDTVAVQGYDVVATVDADTPALFEFVAERPGVFPVRFRSDGRLAGVIVVRPRGAGR